MALAWSYDFHILRWFLFTPIFWKEENFMDYTGKIKWLVCKFSPLVNFKWDSNLYLLQILTISCISQHYRFKMSSKASFTKHSITCWGHFVQQQDTNSSICCEKIGISFTALAWFGFLCEMTTAKMSEINCITNQEYKCKAFVSKKVGNIFTRFMFDQKCATQISHT